MRCLLHADAKARDQLRNPLTANGSLAKVTSEPDLLTADLAETITHKADQLFQWVQDNTGIQASFLDSAWVGPDKC